MLINNQNDHLAPRFENFISIWFHFFAQISSMLIQMFDYFLIRTGNQKLKKLEEVA